MLRLKKGKTYLSLLVFIASIIVVSSLTQLSATDAVFTSSATNVVNLTIPYARLTEFSFSVEGSFYAGALPSNITIDLLNDSVIDWSYNPYVSTQVLSAQEILYASSSNNTLANLYLVNLSANTEIFDLTGLGQLQGTLFNKLSTVPNGALGITSLDSLNQQTLLVITNTSVEHIFVPQLDPIEGTLGLYVALGGSTYYCNTDHSFTFTSNCDLAPSQALVPTHLARAAPAAGFNTTEVVVNPLTLAAINEYLSSCTQPCTIPVTIRSQTAGNVSLAIERMVQDTATPTISLTQTANTYTVDIDVQAPLTSIRYGFGTMPHVLIVPVAARDENRSLTTNQTLRLNTLNDSLQSAWDTLTNASHPLDTTFYLTPQKLATFSRGGSLTQFQDAIFNQLIPLLHTPTPTILVILDVYDYFPTLQPSAVKRTPSLDSGLIGDIYINGFSDTNTKTQLYQYNEELLTNVLLHELMHVFVEYPTSATTLFHTNHPALFTSLTDFEAYDVSLSPLLTQGGYELTSILSPLRIYTANAYFSSTPQLSTLDRMLLGTLSQYDAGVYTFYTANITRSLPKYEVNNLSKAFNTSASSLYVQSFDELWWDIRTNSTFDTTSLSSFSFPKAQQAGRALFVFASDAAHPQYFQVFNTNARSSVSSTTELLDTIPPVQLFSFTSVTLTNSSIILSWDDPLEADFDKVLFTLNGVNRANTTSSNIAITNLSMNVNYLLQAYTQDVSGNVNPVSLNYTFMIVPKQPVRTNGSPTTLLPAGTTTTTLSLTTDENAICRYATISGRSFALMTQFTTTSSTVHNTTLPNLQNSTSYTYYVKCNNTAGIVNTNDYTISFSVDGPVSLTTLLAAHWEFNESSGSIAADSSPNARTATLINNPTHSVGKIGPGALQFDGVNDYAQVGDLDLAPSLSISLWMKKDTAISGWNSLVMKANTYGFEMFGQQLDFGIGDGASWSGKASTTITLGEWHHVVGVFASNTIRLYLDGTLVDTQNAVTLTSSSQPLLIGSWDTSGEFYQGQLDEVRIYNRSLSQSEVTQLYTIGLPPPDVTPPTVFFLTASRITAINATITWSTNEAANSTIEYGTTTSYGSAVHNTARVTNRSLVLSGLTPSTLYHYRVRSSDASNNTNLSLDATFTTLAPPDITPPALLSITASNINATSATISWSTNEAANSTIEYGLSTTYTSFIYGSSRLTSRSFTLNGLLPDATYHYRVKSTDASGNTNTSIDFVFNTPSLLDDTCTDNDRDGMFEYNVTSCPSGTDVCFEPLVTNWINYTPILDESAQTFTLGPGADFRNISNLTITLPGIGQIVFPQRLRIVDVSPTGCFTPLNLTNLIEVRDKYVHISSELFSEFAKPASIYFENISFTQPKVLRNNVDCPASICTIQNYNSVSHALRLDVTGFSSYEIVEGYVPPTQPQTGTGSGSSSSGSSSSGGGGGAVSTTTSSTTTSTPSTTQETPAQTQPEQQIPAASPITGSAINEENADRTGLFSSLLSWRIIGVIIAIALIFVASLYLSLRRAAKGKESESTITHHEKSPAGSLHGNMHFR